MNHPTSIVKIIYQRMATLPYIFMKKGTGSNLNKYIPDKLCQD